MISAIGPPPSGSDPAPPGDIDPSELECRTGTKIRSAGVAFGCRMKGCRAVAGWAGDTPTPADVAAVAGVGVSVRVSAGGQVSVGVGASRGWSTGVVTETAGWTIGTMVWTTVVVRPVVMEVIAVVTGATVVVTVFTVCAATDVTVLATGTAVCVTVLTMGATTGGNPGKPGNSIPDRGFAGGGGRWLSACASALPASKKPNNRPVTTSERRRRPMIRGSIDLTLPANAHIHSIVPEATQTRSEQSSRRCK